MTDDGYTLTEMVVALALVGLLMAGAGTAAQISARTETRVSDTRALLKGLQRFELEMRSDLDLAVPAEGGLSGDPARVTFPCGAAICSWSLDEADHTATLVRGAVDREIKLEGVRKPAFGYVDGAGAVLDAWPGGTGPLRAILLRDETRIVTALPVHAEQPLVCNFDEATGTCAGAGGGL